MNVWFTNYGSVASSQTWLPNVLKRLTRAGSDDLEWAKLKNPAIGEEIRCTVQLSKLVLAKTVSVEAWKDDPSKFMPSPTELAQRETDEAPTKQLDKTYTWQL